MPGTCVTQSRAQYEALHVRRFSALCCIILLFLHRSGTSRYCKLLWLTGLWISASTSRLPTTALTPFVLIRASLVYRGRAIPSSLGEPCATGAQKARF
jgi:hypothetical protein